VISRRNSCENFAILCAASKQVASVAVVVDAIDRDAVRFYLKYGFVEFPVVPMKLYMAIDEIEKSIRSK
jgi:hypothetical protein